MILSRSSWNVNVPSLDPPTDEVVNVSIWVKGGNNTDSLGTADYIFQKRIPTLNTTYLDFRINDIVKDYIEPKPVWSSVNALINSNAVSQRFVNVSFNIDNGSETTLVNRKLATKGYYEYTQGINPNVTKNFLIDQNYIQCHKGAMLFIPIYVTENASVIIDDGANEVEFTITPAASIESQIKYVFFNTSNVNSKYITIIYRNNITDDVDITCEIVSECKYTPKQIVFLNKYGAYQQMFFFKQSERETSTENETFKNAFINNNAYDVTKHQYKQFNKQGRDKITLSTGYIKEEQNTILEQLTMSEDVYLREGSVFIPVNVSTKTINYRTRLVDKLINYTMEFEYAFDKITNL